MMPDNLPDEDVTIRFLPSGVESTFKSSNVLIHNTQTKLIIKFVDGKTGREYEILELDLANNKITVQGSPIL